MERHPELHESATRMNMMIMREHICKASLDIMRTWPELIVQRDRHSFESLMTDMFS